MAEPRQPEVRTTREPPADHAPRVLDAAELFRGEREIYIEHEGVRYRLRLTRRNRLILQK